MLRRLATQHALPMQRKKLIQLVHVKAGELGMDPDTRRELQRQLTGKGSCAEMDLGELGIVYRRLRLLSEDAGLGTRRRDDAARKRRRGRDERLPAEPITREQLELIEHLRAHIGLHASELWMQLCRRVLKHPWPQSREEGNKIIECLKSMERRGWRATRAPGTVAR